MICPHCGKSIDQGKPLMEVFELTGEETPEEKQARMSGLAANIYAEYPRKIGRGAALKAIQIALKKVSYEELLVSTKAYARQWAGKKKDDMKYCPHPVTWFRQERWADEMEEVVEYEPTEATEEEASLF